MRKLVAVLIVAIVGIGLFLFITHSLPYSDSPELLSAEISIDSIWSVGPTAGIYDERTKTYYWLKSYSSLDQSEIDKLKNKTATIRYMKFLKGPLENRISWMEVDSVVVFDQLIKLR